VEIAATVQPPWGLRRRLIVLGAAVVLGSAFAGCQAEPTPTPTPPTPKTLPTTTLPPTSSAPATVGDSRPSPATNGAVLVGAGDIGVCGETEDEATAALLDRTPGAVFTAGDNAYDDGSAKDFSRCFQSSWGRHRGRIRPAAGNHDYQTGDARGYFDYFGAAAGDPAKGYYSYNVGAWHLVVLNSNCDDIGGCGADSDQVRWLRADLAATPTRCTLAYWHHPYFTSGDNHEPAQWMRPLVEILYEGGVDVVVAAHNHNYERFAPQTPDNVRDDSNGLRAFVVGTGGAGLYGFRDPEPNSEVRNDDTHGVIKFMLNPTSYSWQFLPVPGKTFTDNGTARCH
jgi:hypothetical protein